jgi:glycosyltransferase involved in cell wall biosynthesis
VKKEISLIIPTYNRGAGLNGLFNTIINQSIDHKLVDVIIINNASMDNTDEVCK